MIVNDAKLPIEPPMSPLWKSQWARDDALEEAAQEVRNNCQACGGSGHADAETECEYCGRTMQSIYNMKDKT
jgi:hypothetical protein